MVDRKFRLFKESIHKASKNILPNKKRKENKDWMTEEILNLMKTRKEMKKPEDEDQSEEYKEVDCKIDISVDGKILEQVSSFPFLSPSGLVSLQSSNPYFLSFSSLAVYFY